MPSMRSDIRTIDEALQKFRENYKELGIIIHKQEKEIQFLEKKAMHLSMFYIAFQLLIFLMTHSKPISAVDQCRKYWSKLLILSLSVAIAFGLNFATTIAKYMRIKYGQDRNYMDQQENYHQMAYLERLGRNNSGMDILTTIDADYLPKAYRKEGHQQHEPDLFAVYQRYAHIAITANALLAFTILVLYTCHASACPSAVRGNMGRA